MIGFKLVIMKRYQERLDDGEPGYAILDFPVAIRGYMGIYMNKLLVDKFVEYSDIWFGPVVRSWID